MWLTIPVYSKGAQTKNIPINKIQIRWDQPWNRDHWKSIELSYKKAPFFLQYSEEIKATFDKKYDYLSDFTIDQTMTLTRLLGISHTKFLRSSAMNISASKTDRLIQILLKLGADHYITGPSAKNYIEPEKFHIHNIHLEYMDYNYPAYQQLYPPYEEQVSILDLLFMTGEDALQYIETQK